ncbi:DUF2807 domain-containing protein [Pelobium sp.]|nr:head GIN domain-containing protein [Pelobium sp.]MDA9555538.1 DUF2807 domain-containing protein [Pelobium sp.]
MRNFVKALSLSAAFLTATVLPSKAVVVAIHQSEKTTETRQVSNFNEINSFGSFNVLVKLDGTESLKLEGSSEDLAKIETVVENGVLKIRPKKQNNDQWNWKLSEKVNVYISAKKLSALTLNGSGNIKVDGKLTGENFAIKLNGSGNINTNLSVAKANMALNGSGNIVAAGKVDDLSVAIAGSGLVDATELKATESNLKIAGSGNIKVDADKKLTASLLGSGSVKYVGNPEVNVSKMGSGTVSKMK